MYICVEGNIGAGKTTIARALAKYYKAEFLPERFEENNLLPLFYKNKKKLAHLLEYSFLIERYAQIHHCFNDNRKKKVVADYSIYKCLWFAKATLNKREYTFYKKQFAIVEEEIPKPDVIIYLKTGHQNLLSNIKTRGRKYEGGIDKNYLSLLDKSYERGLKKLGNIGVLEIEIKAYRPETNDQVLNQIEKYLNKRRFFK
jgi:deoxyguanosine kinase